jgi:hypothetical protein
MKKSKICLMALFMVLLFSCKQTKESPEPITNSKNKSQTKQAYKPANYNGVKNNGEYISFDTRQDFEDIVSKMNDEEELDHFHNTIGHNSRYKDMSLKEDEDTISIDNSLNSVLNPENIVQIENHVFKLDFENDLIYAVDVKNISELQALKYKDTTNQNIKVFSMEYETFDLIDAGLKRNPEIRNEKFFNWFSPCGWAAPRDDDKNYPYGGGEYNLKVILRYQRAGVWFSLVSKFVNRTRLGFIWLNQRGHKMGFEFEHRYEVRCNRHVARKIGYQDVPTININGQIGLSHKIVYRPHSGMRALRRYEFSIIGANFTGQVFTRLHKIKFGY